MLQPDTCGAQQMNSAATLQMVLRREKRAKSCENFLVLVSSGV